MPNFSVDDFSAQLERELQGYEYIIAEDLEAGLDAAGEVLIKELEQRSPSNTGKYGQSWKMKKKYKRRRYVGNTKTVKGKKGDVPLSNILEHSTNKSRPHMAMACSAAEGNMLQAILEKIKGES